MTTLAQAHAWAKDAGFTGVSLEIVTAIAYAESALNPRARNVNSNGTVDRGILQINATYHPEVSDSCAYDPACAFRAAYAISDGGKNFTPWSTYENGAYKRYMGSNVPDPKATSRSSGPGGFLGGVGNDIGGAFGGLSNIPGDVASGVTQGLQGVGTDLSSGVRRFFKDALPHAVFLALALLAAGALFLELEMQRAGV